MKLTNHTFLLIIFIIITQNVFTQNKVYFNDAWEETSQENAVFYRIVDKKNDSLFYVKDYYINGTLQMDGVFSNLIKETFEGEVRWYYENGNIKVTQNYIKGKLDGKIIRYLKNGSFLSKGTYKNGAPYSGIIKKKLSYPTNFIEYNKGEKQIEITYYKNSTQIAVKKYFLSPLELNGISGEYPKKEIFYNKQDQVLATLHYSTENTNYKSYGEDVIFYEKNNQVIGLKTKTTYLNEEKNGIEISYNKDGITWLTGINKAGKKYNGDFLDEFTQKKYENGIQVGDAITYNKNLKIIAKVSYKNGVPYNGTKIYKKVKKTYKNGILHYKEKFYTEKLQNIKEEITYTNNERLTVWHNKQGDVLGSGYSNNNLVPQNGFHKGYNTHSNYKDGKKDGEEIQFNYYDKVEAKRFFRNGVLIWEKWEKLDTTGFYYCDYKNDKPYNGIILNHQTEQYYKDGNNIKIVDYIKNKETGKYTIEKISEYKEGEYSKITTRETKYKDDKIYIINYKDGKPYNGVLLYYDSYLETYENGIKNGVYEIYKNDKPVEKGVYKNGERHGTIAFSPLSVKSTATTCEFANGEPIDGIVFTEKERTPYKNKLINGQKILFHTSMYAKENTEFIHYINGIKEGKASFQSKLINTRGIYKNNLPYNGEFYNFETKTKNSYNNGKKNGVEIKSSSFIKLSTEYKNNIKLSEESKFIAKDSLLTKGIYKNNKPYLGSFLSINENSRVTKASITQYKKGKKHAKESEIQIYNTTIDTIQYYTYKTGKKEGKYFSKDKDKLPYKVKTSEGIYKNNVPYTGVFITSNIKGLKTLSHYKNGKKDGLELYETSYNKRDSLFYKNGNIDYGKQIEILDSTNGAYYYTHYFENGKKTKTVLLHPNNGKIEIFYTLKGFYVKTESNNEVFNIDPEVIFDGKTQTSGLIKYSENKIPLGFFKFKNGKLVNGKLKLDVPTKGFKEEIIIEIKDERITTTFKLDDKVGLYFEIWRENKSIGSVSYKDHNILLKGFSVSDDETNFIKQYLNDGTLIAESTLYNYNMIGTMITFQKQDNETYLYSITHQKEGQSILDAKKIENLTLKEALIKIKELQKQ